MLASCAHFYRNRQGARLAAHHTRAQFDALRGPTGALLIGDAKTVAKKILYVNEVLGGISRITFQMGVSTLPHEKMLHATEILGTQVAPIVRSELSVTPVRA